MSVKTDFLRNGMENGLIAKTVDTKTSKFWPKFQINEWTFSLLLFIISFGIVLGKLYINYGAGTQWSVNSNKNVHSLSSFERTYDIFAVPNSQRSSNFNEERLKIASEKLFNVSREYRDAMAGAFVGITYNYGWLFRAAISGISMMAFTWFIIYKDSSIPGVNPPSPFSPSKKRYPEKSRIQINYLIGALNGALIFVYMCL